MAKKIPKVEVNTPKVKLEKFAAHYAMNGNGTQAYLSVYPTAGYDTARTEGSRMLARPSVKEFIENYKERFIIEYMQTKEQTINDIKQTAEEAKAVGNYNAYAKLRDMIIKLLGHYEPDKLQVIGEIEVNFGDES